MRRFYSNSLCSKDLVAQEAKMTDAYRVRVSVRNNLILQRIEAAGHDSIASFCRAAGIACSPMYRR